MVGVDGGQTEVFINLYLYPAHRPFMEKNLCLLGPGRGWSEYGLWDRWAEGLPDGEAVILAAVKVA